MNRQKTLTSGEVAQFCDVNLRTVIRWIEKGHLKGFKLPGRGNNRILVTDFIEFLNSHQMPIPRELQHNSSRALVIDDDQSMAAAIKRVLKRAEFEVDVAHDGLQAGVKLAEFHPNLLILDLKMPNMNGFEVLKFLKEGAYKQTKVLVLSGAGDAALAKAKSLGADAVMEKPFDNTQLLEQIKSLF